MRQRAKSCAALIGWRVVGQYAIYSCVVLAAASLLGAPLQGGEEGKSENRADPGRTNPNAANAATSDPALAPLSPEMKARLAQLEDECNRLLNSGEFGKAHETRQRQFEQLVASAGRTHWLTRHTALWRDAMAGIVLVSQEDQASVREARSVYLASPQLLLKGMSRQAIGRVEQCYETYSRILGADNILTIDCAMVLAYAECDARKFQSAKRHLELTIEPLRKSLGDDHPTLATAWMSLGRIERGLRNFDESLKLFDRSIQIAQPYMDRKEALSVVEQAFALSRMGAAGCLNDMGRFAEAEATAADAYTFIRERQKFDVFLMAGGKVELARSLSGQEKYDAAGRAFSEAVVYLDSLRNPPPPKLLLSVLAAHVEHMRRSGQTDNLVATESRIERLEAMLDSLSASQLPDNR